MRFLRKRDMCALKMALDKVVYQEEREPGGWAHVQQEMYRDVHCSCDGLSKDLETTSCRPQGERTNEHIVITQPGNKTLQKGKHGDDGPEFREKVSLRWRKAGGCEGKKATRPHGAPCQSVGFGLGW